MIPFIYLAIAKTVLEVSGGVILATAGTKIALGTAGSIAGAKYAQKYKEQEKEKGNKVKTSDTQYIIRKKIPEGIAKNISDNICNLF